MKQQQEQLVARRAVLRAAKSDSKGDAAGRTAGDKAARKAMKREREARDSNTSVSAGGGGASSSSSRLVKSAQAEVQAQARASDGVYQSLFHSTASGTHLTQTHTDSATNARDAQENYSKRQRDALFIGTSGLRYSIS